METELTSWLEPSKGMLKTQKERLGMYMDEFRTKNGGCLLSEDAKITEFSAYPETSEEGVKIYLYGLSAEQARKHNSDALAELELLKRANNTEVTPDKAKIVIITLGKDSETRKYV